ncbi:cytoplasmic dynein 2 intermediate chain 1 isoform X2 [Halyomorpha halys]|uniref:cytoplasmic dynein 2 intermediate chain 1 isoform X2 n=1 Tax=Halyomorpha halys TaxID=286706 RepID=UPI0006D5237D|nr:WD repeat-containing protein 60 isoform X2 [Halyomorpha halys]
MAKKGGSSEINGFIKSDDVNQTKKKISSRTSGAATNIKSNASRSSRKELDDGIKSTKVINKDAVENKTKGESSVTKVTNKEGTELKSKRESSITKSGQSSVNITSNAKSRVLVNALKTNKASVKSVKETSHKEQVLKGKTNEIPPSKRLPTEQNIRSRRDVTEDVSKAKKSTNPSEKRTSLVATRSSEKIQRGSSKDKKIKNEPKDSVIKERGNVSHSRKTEAGKKTSIIKKTEINKNDEKSISNKKVTHKSSISTNDNILMKQNTVIRSVTNTNEKDNKSPRKVKTTYQEHLEGVKITEPVISDSKEESSKDNTVAEKSYKDLIYFEVDMVDSKLTSNRVHSARIKSASQPHPVTRQGTFTKDDSPNHSDTEVQLMKESSVKENHFESQDNSEEVEYEDDFEDYESDFEEYVSESESESGLSSKSETDSQLDKVKPLIKTESAKVFKPVQKVVEEERKLDSGNYDLSSKPVFPSSIKQKQLDLIKEAISQENISLFDKRKKIIVPVKEKREESKVVILDFVGALKKIEHIKKIEKEKQRSAMILQMINLHEQNINLFEGVFSDDDIFRDIYQDKNVSHAFSQTSSLLKEEASQTNDILVKNKWTQYPISYHGWTNKYFSFKQFMEDQRGYGGDDNIIDYKSWLDTKYNENKLYNFMKSASKVVLILLEEEARWRSREKNMSIDISKDDLGLSDGCVSMQTEKLSFLEERPICDIVFSPHDSNVFVSSYQFVENFEKLSYVEQFYGRSILCVWNMLQPSQPLHLLVASCEISAITFDSEYDNFVYAGVTDGSIYLWDLNEPSIYHKKATAGKIEYFLRTPTFCTSYLAANDYHLDDIVSIKSIGYETDENLSSYKFNPTQIITLDINGKVVLWIVTRVTSTFERADHSCDKINDGMSPWGKFRLVMAKTLNPGRFLPESERNWGLQCSSMILAPDYEYNEKKYMKSILVGTNLGNIIHFYTTEDEIDVPVFLHELGDNCSMSVTCLESNPHGFPIFMAGSEDGSIRFYILDNPQPFKIIRVQKGFEFNPVLKVKWSPLGLGLFYVLDQNFSLHFWDICKNNSFPQLSVSLKALQATDFDVTCDEKFVYIGWSVQRCKIDIHRVKDKFITTNSEEEKEFFVKLVKRYSDIYNESENSSDSMSYMNFFDF